MAEQDKSNHQPSTEQGIQQLNNIVRMLSSLYEKISTGIRHWHMIGHNASGATGTAFTAIGEQIIEVIQVSSTSGADAVTVNWVDSSAGTTHNIITDGVIGVNYPLYLPGPFPLEDGDTITYSGADADMDFIVTYWETHE